MYENEALMRRQRQRSKNMRRRRLKRKIHLCVSLVLTAVVLAAAGNLVGGMTLFHGKSIKDLLAERREDIRTEETKQTFVDAGDANLIYPKAREGEELYGALSDLAETDGAFREILEDYEDYPEELIAALVSNPEMLPFVQGYPDADGQVRGGLTSEETQGGIPLLLQWDARWGYAPYGTKSCIALSGCAPTCLSMVIVSLTGDASATPDAIADFAMQQGYYLEGTGTVWSIMTEGAAHYGVTGAEVSLDENEIRRHLKNGEPIICSMRPGDFTTAGHFIVLTGVVDGKLTVNDPNSRARSEVLWDYGKLAQQIKNLWAFTKS